MAEDALYCMRVVGTQISLRHSADCLGTSRFTFVWFACIQPVGTPSRPYGRSGSPLVVEWHLVDSYRHICVYCMKPKALYYC